MEKREQMTVGEYSPVEAPFISITLPIEKFGIFYQLSDEEIARNPLIKDQIRKYAIHQLLAELEKKGYVQHGDISFREAEHYPTGGCDGSCPVGECNHSSPRMVDYGLWVWVHGYKIPEVFDEVLKNERRIAVQRHLMGIVERD